MYLVRSLRTFIGTEEERTNAGLAAFLAGDEYIEVDESGVPTGLEYIHTGMAWLLNSSAGSPGGSDTQVQFNDDGVFGGASSLIYDKILGDFRILGDGNSHLFMLDYSTNSIGFGTNGAFGTIALFNPSGIVYNDDGQDVDFRVESNNYSNIFKVDAGLDAVQIGTAAAGTIADFRSTGIVFNEEGENRDFRIEGDTATNLLITDAGLDAVRIGTTIAGALLDVAPTGIIFNDGEDDIDLRIAGNGVTNAYFYDAGLNRHGFGTGTPGAFVYIDNTETSGTPETGLTVDNTYSPSSDPGSVFPTSLSLLADYDSSTTPSGGFVLAQFLRARNVSNGVMSARCLDIQFQNLGTGTTPFFTGVNVRTPTNSGGGAITTAYGLKVESQNIAGTNYAVYTDAGRVRFGDGVTIDTTTAALTIPRMTTTQQNALTGVNGMLIYNSSTNKVRAYAGGAWVDLH